MAMTTTEEDCSESSKAAGSFDYTWVLKQSSWMCAVQVNTLASNIIILYIEKNETHDACDRRACFRIHTPIYRLNDAGWRYDAKIWLHEHDVALCIMYMSPEIRIKKINEMRSQLNARCSYPVSRRHHRFCVRNNRVTEYVPICEDIWSSVTCYNILVYTRDMKENVHCPRTEATNFSLCTITHKNGFMVVFSRPAHTFTHSTFQHAQ